MSNLIYVLNPEEESDKKVKKRTFPIPINLFWIRLKRKMKNPIKLQRLKYYQNDYIRYKKDKQARSST